ncbi:MAG: hypothetical protein HQ582_12200, partial [Planctomycetes bacterium]|nr:hypothetical protein [Planctomycetota bacterium]
MSEGRGRTPPGGRPDDADRAGESERVYVDPVFPVKRPDLNELRRAADSDAGGFQFTLREMFVAILLVALVLG